MATITLAHRAATDSRQQLNPLPDTVRLTGAAIRSWRQRGYRISEQRVTGWRYLLARSDLESAVYKVRGPIFRGQLVYYDARRVA